MNEVQTMEETKVVTNVLKSFTSTENGKGLRVIEGVAHIPFALTIYAEDRTDAYEQAQNLTRAEILASLAEEKATAVVFSIKSEQEVALDQRVEEIMKNSKEENEANE